MQQRLISKKIAILKIKEIFTYFVLIIPVFFAIAENTTGYFLGGTLNPGTIRGAITAIFLLFFVIKYYPIDRLNMLILGFTLYYLLLCFFSSSYSVSFYGFFKFSIATLMFPLGYFFINNYNLFQNLNKFYFVALLLFVINIVIANVFNLGSSDYLEDSFYFGAGRVNITKFMIVILFASINLFPILNKNQIKAYLFLLAIAAFITIVGIKRSVLLSFGIGVFFFLFYNRLKFGFFRISAVILLGLMTLTMLYPEGLDLLESRFSAREESIGISEELIETEGRIDEITMVLTKWIHGGIMHKLFGSELFNDREFFNTSRMLHTDYMVVLNGSGLVGIIWWFSIIFGIYAKGNKYLSFFNNDPRFTFLKASFYSIIAAQLLMSISGTIQGIGLRSYILLYLGAIVGTLRGEYKRMLYLNEIDNI